MSRHPVSKTARELFNEVVSLSTAEKLRLAADLVETRPDVALMVTRLALDSLRIRTLDERFATLKREGKL